MLVGRRFIKYKAVYSWSSLAVLVSVVVTLERTFAVHASRVAVLTVERLVPAGISASTLRHAWAVEIKETPTREVTAASAKVKTAPRRCVRDSYEVVSLPYAERTSDVRSVPRKVLKEKGCWSK